MGSTRLETLKRGKKFKTIRDFARALLLHICIRDADDRPIGFDYGEVMRLLKRRFPIVTYPGPHRGKPFNMSYKELGKLACELNRDYQLPFRPPRPRIKKK